jgi:hypothetical protein
LVGEPEYAMIPADGANYFKAIAAVEMAMAPASKSAIETALAVLEVSTNRSKEGAWAAKLGLAVFAGALGRYPADIALTVLARMSETIRWAPPLSDILEACDNAVAPRRELLASLIWSQGKTFKEVKNLPPPRYVPDEVLDIEAHIHPPTRTQQAQSQELANMEV